MIRVYVLLFASCWAACGAPVPRTRTALDAARLELAQSLRVKERAPELWREVEHALATPVGTHPDEAMRADQAALARLWLEAAIAECERADLAAKRLEIEREIDSLNAAALRDQQAAKTLTQQSAREAAAKIARDEAARALERAALTPVQRPKLDKSTEAQAARAILTRAKLVLETARALGAQASSLAEATSLIERANSTLDTRPDLSLDAADRALSRALTTLGPLRAGHEPISAAEKQALVDDLEALGGQVRREDRGLSAELEGVFATGDRLSPSASRRLLRVCSVAAAHPHGAVRFSLAAASEKSVAARRNALLAVLPSAGCEGERYGVDARAGQGPALALTWLAY